MPRSNTNGGSGSIAGARAGLTPALAAAVRDHLTRHLGPPREILPADAPGVGGAADPTPMEVFAAAPGEGGGARIYVTMGMSATPMGPKPAQGHAPRAELLLRLPADWPMDPEGSARPAPGHDWPLAHLRDLAGSPARGGEAFTPLVLVGNQDPMRALSPDCDFVGFILMPVYPPEFATLRAPGFEADLLEVVPLFVDEFLLARAESQLALLERFRELDLDHERMWDPARPNAGDPDRLRGRVRRTVIDAADAAAFLEARHAASPSDPDDAGTPQSPHHEEDDPMDRKTGSTLGGRGGIPTLTRDQADLIHAHVRRHLGEHELVVHEKESETLHLDLLPIPPGDGRGCWTFVTMGMSAAPMEMPHPDAGCGRAELFVRLPPDWPMNQQKGGVVPVSSHYWPLAWLQTLAKVPVLHETFFAPWHTIPNDGPMSPDCRFVAWMLMRPADEAVACLRSPGFDVDFLEVIPLYQEELDLVLAEDASALFERFGDADLDPELLWHPDRPNAAE